MDKDEYREARYEDQGKINVPRVDEKPDPYLVHHDQFPSATEAKSLGGQQLVGGYPYPYVGDVPFQPNYPSFQPNWYPQPQRPLPVRKRFIQVKTTQGDLTFLNIDHIVSIKAVGKQSVVKTVSDNIGIIVDETATEIISKIRSWE